MVLLKEISIEQQKYDESKAELDAAQKQLDDTAATLAQTKSELDAAKASLNGVPQQLASGKAQIQSGWTEIRKQEKKLEEGAAFSHKSAVHVFFRVAPLRRISPKSTWICRNINELYVAFVPTLL